MRGKAIGKRKEGGKGWSILSSARRGNVSIYSDQVARAIASGEKESRARGVDSLIRQLGGRGGASRFDPFNRR